MRTTATVSITACALGALGAALVMSNAPAARAASELGEAQFKKSCAMCHSLEPGRNKLGPSLSGVLDRKAGTVAGFNYSSANKNSGLVWTRETLDTYLTDPQKMVPGTLMVFPGIKNAGDRQALVEFLAAQHD
ncbi:c-type cytochrome [Bradyrhizobium sp. USDA 4353]